MTEHQLRAAPARRVTFVDSETGCVTSAAEGGEALGQDEPASR